MENNYHNESRCIIYLIMMSVITEIIVKMIVTFMIDDTKSLSSQEQVCLTKLRFERYVSNHLATLMIMSRMFRGSMLTLTLK